ncbi:hypothetical protein ACQY0O_001991 [Thecaphora frezii]
MKGTRHKHSPSLRHRSGPSGVFNSDMSMRSDITLVQQDPANDSFRRRTPSIDKRSYPRHDSFSASSHQSGHTFAAANSSRTPYQPTRFPSSSFRMDSRDQHFKANQSPPSPVLTDDTFHNVSSSAIEVGVYPLTKFTKETASKMNTSSETLHAVDMSTIHMSAKSPIQATSDSQKREKDWRFWVIFASLMVVCILTALDMTMISTALPGIVRSLPASDISGTWITSAYLLTMTASQPAFGGLSCVAGRRWSITIAVVLFLAGSVACALSRTMFALSAARGLQGLGGGGIQALGEIIVSDLTTLKERGFFIGLVGLVFAVSSFVAPVLGGLFSSSNWHWIFWINLPIGAIGLFLIVPFMNLSTPSMSMREKIERMDLAGNLVLFGSVVGILIGTTDGGITHPWSDAKVWLPVLLGCLGFCLFLAIEFIPNRFCRSPILPLKLFSNKTAASAFFQTFVHGIITYGCIYILPIFFQAIKDESPLRSAISTFPATAPSAPFAIIAGIVMALTGKYKITLFLGWGMTCLGAGWLTRFQVGTPTWELYVSQFITGIAVGTLFAITLPPIQASLPASELELATATFAFCRSFGSIWGIAVATTIFTTTVAGKLTDLPEAAQFGLTGRTALGFVEEIKHLPETIREPVRQIFADGLQNAMWLFLPLGVIGYLSCFLIEELPLPDFIRSDVTVESETTTGTEAKGGAHDKGEVTFNKARGTSGHRGKADLVTIDLSGSATSGKWGAYSNDKDAHSHTSSSLTSPPGYPDSTFHHVEYLAGRSTERLNDGGASTLVSSESGHGGSTMRGGMRIEMHRDHGTHYHGAMSRAYI